MFLGECTCGYVLGLRYVHRPLVVVKTFSLCYPIFLLLEGNQLNMRNLSFTLVLTIGHYLPTETTASVPFAVSMVGPCHVALQPQSSVKGPEHNGKPCQGLSSTEQSSFDLKEQPEYLGNKHKAELALYSGQTGLLSPAE